MEPSLLKIAIVVILIYGVIPTIFIRFGGVGAISRAPGGTGRIAITFDDGPDPRYTPQILDILENHQVKACFFVVGSKAKAYPNIIRQIAQAGHEVGNHGFSHRIAWLLGPGATTSEIMESNRAIEELTGEKTWFCRPAWGLFNLSSIWYCWLKGFKVVLWTFMSWDWSKRATPESITRRVLKRVKDGAILVFHDSDSMPGAAKGGPAQVVAALPTILDGLKQRGLKVAPLTEITNCKVRRNLLKKYIQRLWGFVESGIRRLAGIRNFEADKNSIWRVALRRYRGKDWPLSDGSVLRRGDQYLELHVNNERLLSLINEKTSVERMGIIIMREVRNSLPPLARSLYSDGRYTGVKALLGITLLHRGTQSFGFTVYDMKPGLFSTVTSWYERCLLALFHPGGIRNLRSYREKLIPKYVVMTRQELMQKYLPAEAQVGNEGQLTQRIPYKNTLGCLGKQ